MLGAIIPTLARIGLFGSAVEGGRYVWRAASNIARGTAIAPVLAGTETVARSLSRDAFGPLDPFKLLDEETGILSGKMLPTISGSSLTMRTVAQAESLRHPVTLAGPSQGETILDATKRRFAVLSARFGARAAAAHQASPDCPEAIRFANQSLALAGASRNPPTDPRAVLASNDPPSLVSTLTDLIDSLNRAEEPDLDILENRLIAGPGVAGACCEACAKKTGPCASGACGASKPKGYEELGAMMKFGPAVAGDDEDDEDDEDEDEDDEEIAGHAHAHSHGPTDGFAALRNIAGEDDEEETDEEELLDAVEGAMPAVKKGCSTGQCWSK